MPMPPQGIDIDVAAAAAALRALWEAGDPSDPALRQQCEHRLVWLRGLWREHASRFDPETIGTLKSIAEALRRPVPRPAPPRQSPEEVLHDTFGYPSFRPGQAEIIDAVIKGRDCIGVMPTGAGKSLTYQVPARILGGTTLVVSPLIALMKDQVDALNDLGIRATFLNSSVDPDERRRRVQGLRSGAYELVYAAPEGIHASVGWALDRVELRLIAVDEAHCISHWGHDFRPAYRNLAGLKERFGGIPVLALTATATRAVTADIIAQLGMDDPMEFRGSFYRPNLHLHAYRKGEDGPRLRDSILHLVKSRRDQSGIIYCLSRKSVESTSDFLREHGIKALPYHAGMEAAARNASQEAFRDDEVDVIVATVAFGMGIDKSNVRYVIHRDMPRSIEGYYQEVGRAGRDGLASDCVLFYSWADVMSYDRFVTDDLEPEVAESFRRQAREMFRMVDARHCRHQALVAHFGERIERCTGSCDVCAGGDVVSEAATAVRQKPRRPSASRAEGAQTTAPPAKAASTSPAPPESPPEQENVELFLRLKALRKRLAQERKLPAYVVFSDFTLLEMSRRHPKTEVELRAVSGVGPKKMELYGALFLAVLRGETTETTD
ncbi:MAG TPA: ATP-dependent DNA helicase RecQ [Polyangia bacterium]|jgi:ATP-dependent DNA helicase RecQ|nr:ATP-dependent DNA helicase RecQ [Polyangia bacterium]